MYLENNRTTPRTHRFLSLAGTGIFIFIAVGVLIYGFADAIARQVEIDANATPDECRLHREHCYSTPNKPTNRKDSHHAQ